nr:probable E3 ubiquitin-protein ligase makorin-2 isoform X1 [Loxodonta africana]XP_023395906.1 probable E3 ubiquitin-protein ligase makorin-2 isoform X1 [Loxodonta africana]XP_023395907.1 probable E3 ubiquitin-protein ligase makorin-2 isoform X1 [Loxodonta africana]
MNRRNFSLNIIKACPQCRVHSSYVIPHKFWVSKGPQKEQLIQSFKARTSQIRCRFFMRGNGRCPFKSDCIYMHQLPPEASIAGPAWPESVQLASGSEVVTAGIWGRGGCWSWLIAPAIHAKPLYDVNGAGLDMASLFHVQPAQADTSPLSSLFLGQLELKLMGVP